MCSGKAFSEQGMHARFCDLETESTRGKASSKGESFPEELRTFRLAKQGVEKFGDKLSWDTNSWGLLSVTGRRKRCAKCKTALTQASVLCCASVLNHRMSQLNSMFS